MVIETDSALTTSVVLATYNGAAFLEQQLQSLMAQSQKPFEIIISDDDSIDATQRILEEFARTTTVPLHFYINRTKLGFAENFLSAAVRASGDLIAFCDQDDVWHPNKIYRCASQFVNPETVLTVHPARLIDKDGAVTGTFRQGIDGNRLKPPLSYGPWDGFFGFSIVFRRSLLAALPPHDRGVDYITGNSILAHDRWILFVANLLGWTQEIDTELVDYRQHDSNIFGAPRKPAFEVDPVMTRTDCDRYKQSARHLRDLIARIPEQITNEFPSFDRAKCIEFWSHALLQQEARAAVYTAPTFLKGILQLCRNLLGSTYHAPNDRRMLWRSVAKDLIYVAKFKR